MGRTYKTIDRKLNHPVALMLKVSASLHVSVCAFLFGSPLTALYLYVSCILVNVFGLGKFNKYKSQTHFIHKEMGQRRETEMWTLCLQALLGPCVFYIMCNTVQWSTNT